MALLDGLTKNQAELDPEASDADLRPLALSLPPVHAVTWAEQVIRSWPRWTVEAAYEERGMIHATHTSRLWRVVDDVHILFEADSRGSRMIAKSQPRSGRGSGGRNARNLKHLVQGLQREDQARQAQLAESAKANANANANS